MTERELFEAGLCPAEKILDPLRPDSYFTDYVSYRWNLWQEYRAPLLARITELEIELLAQGEKNVLLSVCLRQFEDGEGK